MKMECLLNKTRKVVIFRRNAIIITQTHINHIPIVINRSILKINTQSVGFLAIIDECR